ncbi:probable endolytic peptidoglycan transglycosylase RlpA [Oppia nitens]|uniref:probable endolytic peptidoglycan transglycosylase RlpA n=1 Tax=Oppia nitens TaxID=1686743 RepID=UPI0023DBDAA9|nr:probable endolytic peptidoglycan transglycosylase RlpA [Oppia nitens]
MSKLILLTFAIILATCMLSCISCESGECSWYGTGLKGALTASGEKFDPNALTAAHKTLPFGTMVRVSCNGRTVVVRINDRGPFVAGRILDLSVAGGQQLNIINAGLCQCTVDKA